MKVGFQLTAVSLVLLQSLAASGAEVFFTEARVAAEPSSSEAEKASPPTLGSPGEGNRDIAPSTVEAENKLSVNAAADVTFTEQRSQLKPAQSNATTALKSNPVIVSKEIVERPTSLPLAATIEVPAVSTPDGQHNARVDVEIAAALPGPESDQSDNATTSVTFTEKRSSLELAGGDVRLAQESSRQLESYRKAESSAARASASKNSNPVASALIGRQVVLSNVEFEGNTVVSDSALRDVAAPFIGRPIGLSDLEELRLALTRAYTDEGYLNSGAVLPDQKVVNGNIVYNFVEGELASINIDGEGRLRKDYISERVLKGAARPFNSVALQQNFQLLLNDPLIERMDAQLMALPTLGESELNLRVTRARPYNFALIGSNHGAPSLGEQQYSLAGVVRNIAGLGDHLSISTVGNANKFNLTTAYEVPLSSKETRVRVQFTTADSSVVEEPLDELDIESDTIGAEVAITRTLSRKVGREVTAGTALSVRENSNRLQKLPFDFSLGDVDGRSRASVFKLWRESVTRRSKDVLAARATLNVGVELFDATAHDDGRPDGQFTSLQGQLQYSRRFQGNDGNLLIRGEGQLSSRKLLSLERFALGGASTVRGYRENELVRDEALFLSAEYRYTFLRSHQYGNFQFAPFLDFGYGRNDGFFKDEQTLVSTGFGLLWNLRSRVSGELYYGAALRDVEDRGDSGNLQENGVHLKLAVEL